ncbi:MAG: hypothetical protein ABDH49_05125 [Candidatus Hydrothermales bacterium]
MSKELILLVINFLFNEEIHLITLYESYSVDIPSAIDFNMDKTYEIIECFPAEGNVRTYHTKSPVGQILLQLNFPHGKVGFTNSINLDGGVDLELAFSYLKNDSLFLVFIKAYSDKSWKYFITEVRDRVPPKGWIGSICKGGVLKVKYNNKNILIAVVSTGFDLYPRGVFAIDEEKNEVLWKFVSGATTARWKVENINGDKVPELILGSFSPSNGSDYNGFNDFSSYLFVFDMDGRMLFHHVVGSYSTLAEFIISEPNLEGVRNIYVCELGGVKEEKERNLFLICGKSGEIIKRKKFYENIIEFNSIDINDDGKEELLILFISGNCLIVDKDLNIIKKVDLGKGIENLIPLDINLDGKKRDNSYKTSKLEI